MTNSRIVHQRGFSMKYKQALKGIENCAFAWVVQGESVRDLSLAEKVAALNQQAKEREPLALSELHGLTFEPPATGAASNRHEMQLAYEANKFFTETVQ